MNDPIWVIGMGVEEPPVLSDQAEEIIASAELLVGGKRLLEYYQNHPAEKIPIQGEIDTVLERLQNRGDRRTVVMGSGDPLFHGIGGTLLDNLPEESIQIFPNVTSLQVGFARLGIPWDDACLVSAHAQSVEKIISDAKRNRKLGVLTDRKNTPALIAEKLLEAGIPDCRAVVLEHLGSKRESIIDSFLSNIKEQDFDSLNVMIVLQQEVWRGGVVFPNRDEVDYAHRRGLITKRDLRALSIARLAIRPADIIWDIGAGSGAVSVEMAALACKGTVYAVESDQENQSFIQENRDHYGVYNLEIVPGMAPGALVDLPSPQRVFVGGSGGNLEAIIKVINASAQKGCKVVCNFATLENLTIGLEAMRELDWAPAYSQVNIAHSKKLASLTRLEPLNPVFILEGNIP